MKHETRIKDIQTTLAAATTKTAALASATTKTAALAAAERAVTYGTPNAPDVPAAIEAANAALAAATTAAAALARTPRDRRDMAAKAIEIGLTLAKAAAELGSSYSGDTKYLAKFGDAPSATTSTSRGGQYSRRCTYHKTNAAHHVTIAAAGLPLLVESEALRLCSAREGLHLIALHPDNSAVWVRSHGKAIISERGWVVGNGAMCYHSTKSADDASRGFQRKMAAHEREQKLARASAKVERRAKLIARLCAGAVATIEDARRLGYCSPGIAAFQSRHGIGDTATLPELVRTGNGPAVALALSVARRLSRKKELAA